MTGNSIIDEGEYLDYAQDRAAREEAEWAAAFDEAFDRYDEEGDQDGNV